MWGVFYLVLKSIFFSTNGTCICIRGGIFYILKWRFFGYDLLEMNDYVKELLWVFLKFKFMRLFNRVSKKEVGKIWTFMGFFLYFFWLEWGCFIYGIYEGKLRNFVGEEGSGFYVCEMNWGGIIRYLWLLISRSSFYVLVRF